MLNDILNYRQVTPLLAASGQPSEAELRDIAAAGYEVVINLALHDDPRYSLRDESGAVAELGMVYVHIPVAFGAPKDDDLRSFITAMDQHEGRKLWVHCAANMRVSVFLGLYWHLRHGVVVEEAFALQREIWQPDEVWSAFIERTLTSSGRE